MNPPRPVIAGRCRRPLSGFCDPDASMTAICLAFLADHIMEDRLAPWSVVENAMVEWSQNEKRRPARSERAAPG